MKFSALFVVSTLLINLDGLCSQEQGHQPKCPTVETAPNFDFDAYSKAPWYVHQQMPISYLPIEQFYCVKAEYSNRYPKWWQFQYTVNVYNEGSDESGQITGGELCAYDKGADPAKLAVSPCFLPLIFAGDYWVIAYNESENLDEEYALISGGQPRKYTPEGCRTGTGYFSSGLWIFTRNRERNDDIINTVRDIATENFYDLSVLRDVDQTNCPDDT